MSTFIVFGQAKASTKLINATLDDYLDTHIAHTPDEDFWFIITGKSGSVRDVIDWCEHQEVYYELVEDEDQPMIAAVERGFASDHGSIVLALVGEIEPSVDVRRAIERAVDSHMVVRDLAEGALTYIQFHGDAVDSPPEETMAEAEEEMTLDELVELADEGDEEAIEALSEAAEEAEIDHDQYETWAELAPVLAEALGLETDAPEEAEEEDEEELAPSEGWSEESLKGLTLKEIREHAEAAGIEGARKMARPKLVAALVGGTGKVEEEKTAPPAKAPAKAKAPVASDSGAMSSVDLDELADLIVAKLAAKLSS